MQISESKTFFSGFLLTALLVIPSSGNSAETVNFVKEITDVNFSQAVDVAVTGKGDVYVLDDAKSRILIFDLEGNLKQEFGRMGVKPGELTNAHSLSVSSHEKVFVADTGNHRVQVFNKIGGFLFSFGQSGVLNGQFKTPSGIVVDHLGFIFVADEDNRRIQMFSPHGVFLNSFPTTGRPVDVAVDKERNIFTLQPEAGKIIKYNLSGRKLQELMCLFNDENYMPFAKNLTVDRRGEVYITEGKSQSIKKINRRNMVLLSFGSAGESRGQFKESAGIAVDAQDRIFVADKKSKRVQVFRVLTDKKNFLSPEPNSPPFVEFDATMDIKDPVLDVFSVPGRGIFALSDKAGRIQVKNHDDFLVARDGKELGELKKPSAVTATLDGRIFVADTGNNRIQVFNVDGIFQYHFGQTGNKPGQFNSPQGIAINSKGKIYVADTGNHRIQIFNDDGIYLKTIGEREPSSGRDPSAVQSPAALAIDSRNQVFVLEPQTSRIKVFNEQGQYVAAIGEKGDGPGQFQNPTDIAFDENDNLFVADQGNYRIQIFDPKRKFIMAFGAIGNEPFTFKKVTGVAVAEGRIIVSDYLAQELKIFRYFPDGIVKGERIFSTKTAYPPKAAEMNNVERFASAQAAAQKEAIDVLLESLNYTESALMPFLRVDSVEALNDGQVKVTVSVPQDLQ